MRVFYACILFLSVCSTDTCLFRPDSGDIIHINILTFVKSKVLGYKNLS